MPSSAGRTLISTGRDTVPGLSSRSDSIRSPYRVLPGASSWPRLMGHDNTAMHERCWDGPFKHWPPYGIELARENEQHCHPLCGLVRVQARLGCSPEPPDDPRQWAARRSEQMGSIKVAIHERCWGSHEVSGCMWPGAVMSPHSSALRSLLSPPPSPPPPWHISVVPFNDYFQTFPFRNLQNIRLCSGCSENLSPRSQSPTLSGLPRTTSTSVACRLTLIVGYCQKVCHRILRRGDSPPRFDPSGGGV